MTRETVQAELEAYFEGTLSAAAEATLRAELRSYPDLEGELLLWDDLGTVTEGQPSPALAQRLSEMLDSFQREERITKAQASPSWLSRALERLWPSTPAYSFAAATLFLVIGLTGGWLAGGGRIPGNDDAMLRELRAEVRDTRELAILTMLQQQSATDRLRGVSFTAGLREPNDVVLGALIRTLRYDTSVDVRLASIDALSHHRNQAMVRRAFVEAVQDASNPMVQVELIEQLAGMDDVQARQTLEQMAVNESLDPTVRLAAARKVQAKL